VQQDFVDQAAGEARERFTGVPASPGAGHRSIKALDPGQRRDQGGGAHRLPNWSGVLATGGNLVFTGLWEGALVAYDGKTLQEVWRFDTGCGVVARRISYAVNGKQYVAVAAVRNGTLPPGRQRWKYPMRAP